MSNIKPKLVELGMWLALIIAIPFLYNFIADKSESFVLKIFYVAFWLSVTSTMTLVTLQRLKTEGYQTTDV